MKSQEIIRDMMQKNGLRGVDLAGKLDVSTTALANRLKRGVMGTNILGKMLDVFGYKVVLVPKDTEMKEDWYEVEDDHGDCEKGGN